MRRVFMFAPEEIIIANLAHNFIWKFSCQEKKTEKKSVKRENSKNWKS